MSEILSSYDPSKQNYKDNTCQLLKNSVLATIPLGNSSSKIYLLPCFIPDARGQALNHTAMQTGTPILRAPKHLTEVLSLTVETLSKNHQCDIVIFDCHSGIVEYSSPCCALSDCSVVVSDFDQSSLLSGVLFTARIEQQIKREISKTTAEKTRHWRVIVNRVPSPRQFDKCDSRLKEATTMAAKFFDISNDMVANLKAPLAIIPDLEELRDHRLEEKGELSPARRGGNGFILSTKAMIRNMTSILGTLCDSITFCSFKNEDMRAAFNSLPSVCYVDRGLGRSGITKMMLFLAVVDVTLALLLLFLEKTGIRIFLELALMFLFAFAAYEIIRQNHQSRQCFDMFCTINDITRRKYLERQRLYNRGGSPATTFSIWFPKIAWFLCFLLGFSISIRVGDLPKLFAGWLPQAIKIHNYEINIVIWIIAVIAALFGSVFKFWPGFKSDVKFFICSFCFAVGIFKDKDTTPYC